MENNVFPALPKFEAIFTRCSFGGSDVYTFIGKNNNCRGIIPCEKIDGVFAFPPEMLTADGHICNNSIVRLVVTANGSYVPDRDFYEWAKVKKKADAKPYNLMKRGSLFAAAKPYKACDRSLGQLMSDYLKGRSLSQIPDNELKIVAGYLGLANESGLTDYLARQLDCDLLPREESDAVEFKSSFYHSAQSGAGASAQMNEIFQEIVAFANSRMNGRVIVGVKNDGSVGDLANEMLTYCPHETIEAFKADFLNRLKNLTGSAALVGAIDIEWYQTERNKVFCVISLTNANLPRPIYFQGDLYIRVGTSKMKLEGEQCSEWLEKEGLVAAKVA